jgi:hypothetical protein
MSYLYGDSTPFPYDVNYIELSRNAVDCSMQLLSAQHAIASALARDDNQHQLRHTEQAQLVMVAETIEGALTPFLNADSDQMRRAALRALQSAKAGLEEERAEGERRAMEAASHTQHVIQRAGESAQRALEALLARHDVPETELGLTLNCAGEQGYTGEVAILTPFGVTATFGLRMDAEKAWSRPRRIADLVPGLEIHVPQHSGWISKRVEMTAVKLDRSFLQSVRVAGAELELAISKSPNGGAGYRISLDLHGERGAHVTPLNENGMTDNDPPLVLDGEDGARILELSQRVMESIQGLSTLRGSMRSVSLDGRPLEQLEWPETIAHRLIAQIGPVVQEIGRRSGAPGELVLRRDVGDGRRDEIYVTKAELWERLLVLPPERRAAFGVLGLGQPSLPPPSERPPPASSGPLKLPAVPLYEVAAQAAVVSVGPSA